MATMNVSLPDEMKEWVEKQVSLGRFGNASDYVRDLIRRDQEAVAELQALVDEGLNSGVSELSLDEIFNDARRKARARFQAIAREMDEDSGEDAAA
jgi:antitoxin ParD1/3/4